MKNQLFISLLAMFCCMFNLVAIAQIQDKTLLNKMLPEHVITPVINYEENYIDLKKSKGTPIIIDFWASWCVPCVKEFPRLDSLQSKFKDKVLIIPVAWDDENKSFQIVRRMIKNNLIKNLPIGFDTLLVKKVNAGVLVSVWIDKDGIIKYFTNSTRITEWNLTKFISGKPIVEFEQLVKVRDESIKVDKPSFRTDKPLLIRNNGGADTSFLYRSILTPYLKSVGFVPFPSWLAPKEVQNSIQIVNVPLQYLYELAYRPVICPNPIMSDYNVYGNFSRYSIIEVNDPENFKHSYSRNQDSLSIGRYSYELITGELKEQIFNLDSISRYANAISDSLYYKTFGGPDNRILTLQKIMQQDLFTNFGYKVKIEKRDFPCTYIRKLSKSHIKIVTRGGMAVDEATPFSLVMKNQPISTLIKRLWFAKQVRGKFNTSFGLHFYTDNVIVDDTGITENIDIVINAELSNLDAVNRELLKYGLILEDGKRSMDTIVIFD